MLTILTCFLPENLPSVPKEVTSQGIEFFDEGNEFGLTITKGAVPFEENLAINLRVAVFGPFCFPKDLRPVSPVFHIFSTAKTFNLRSQ